MVLKNLKCVKSTKKQIVPITCSKAVKIKYGECRPQTCRRPLFLIKSVVDPDNCKCKKQQIIKEERECCCLGKSREKKEFCVGNCKIVVNKVSKFDKVNERCVKENFIRRKCPKCPKPHMLEGTCDSTGTCLKTNRHISYTIKNCQCQPVEHIRHERCCCPASKKLGSRCVEDKGVIENKNIYYQLENGQCIKRETIEEKQIICPKTIQLSQSEKNQYCDPNSCQQIVTTYQWNRIGCKCIQQIITIPKLCCCTNRIPRIKKICSPDGSYKSIAQLWKLHNGQCVKTNVVKNLSPPVCKPQDVTPIGPCDKTTGKQPILITRSIIEECECKVVYREKRDRICACQSSTVHVKPCDPNTCLQQTTITKWAIEEKDKKCHRLHPDIRMRPCCCRREVNKDNLFKKCIPTNGQTEITNRTYYFNPHKELCEFKDVKTFINLVCPTEITVVKGSCNLVTGIALDSITSWKTLTSQCKCVKRTNYQKRICSCKHLDRKVKNPVCSKQNNMLLQKKIVHELQNEICQPKVIWMKKAVVCPSQKNVDVKCDPATCNQLTTISWFTKIGCKCEKQQKYIQGKCCCPKPVEYRECQRKGSLLIIKKVTYQLDEYKGKCVRQIDQLHKNVVCGVHGARFIKRVCDKQTCYLATILLKTVLQNCQCQRMMKKIIHRNIRCCCPNPRFQEKCHQNYGIVSRIMYRYELFKKQCITRKFVDEHKVVCPEEKINRGQCDVNTKIRPVQRRFYNLIGCKCQLKIESTMEPCTCPLPVLHKENCTAGKLSRKVWRIIYILRRNDESGKVACEQEKEYLYEEPCHCRKPKFTRKCQNGNKILMKHVEYLVERNDKRFCSVRHYIKRIPVNCRVNAVRMKEEPCQNSLKRTTFMHEILDKQTCECRSQVKVEFEKCDCDKDNRITEFCQNGVRVVNKEINVFSQSQGRCVKSTVRSVRPVVCSTKHQVIKSSGCVIERSDGIYYSEEIRWEQVVNCKCAIKRRQILRLCACPKPTIKTQCLDTVNLATYKNTFINIGGQCIPDQQVITTETRCQEKAQIIGRSTCEKQTLNKFDLSKPPCLETLKISVPTIVNCQCQLKIIQIQRRCCTSQPKVKQICDPFKGRWIKAVENYVLASGSILFKRDDLIIYDQIQKVTSEQQDQTVVCPQSVSYENCDRTTGLLTRVKTYYKRIGCKCKPIKEIIRGKCVSNEICCCPKPITNQSICDPNTNAIIHKQIHYSLIIPTYNTKAFKSYCQSKLSQISVQVKCGKKLQRIRIKPCDGEFHIVSILKPIVENCICKQKLIHKQKIRCGCPTAVRHIPGKCISQWAIHKWIGLNAVPTGVNNTFHITEKSCKPVVIEERRIRCACPPMQVFKKCLNHSLLVIHRIHYKMNKELNNCERYNTKEFKKLACPNTQVTQTPCGNKFENYEQIEIIKHWQTNQCNCLMKVIKNKWICNCHARYPNQVITKCLPNGYQRLTITKIWFNHGRQCLNRTEKQIESIACPKNLRIIKGECSSTGNLQLIYLLQRPQHCQCVWQKLTDSERQALGLRSTEACKCRPSFIVKQCHEANNNRTAYLVKIHTKYILQQGECHIDRKFEKNPVVCQVGSQLHRSQCNPVSNELIETRITTHLRGCQCQQEIAKRRCQCSCPKPKTNAVCQSRDGLLRKIKIIYAYKDDQCTCEAKYYVQSSRIRCHEPPKLIKIGKCHKLSQNESIYVHKNDLYRNLVWNKLHRVGCQCKHQRFMEQFPCYCSPDIKYETQCIKDRILEIRKTERKISEDKKQCIRIVISKVRNPIHLGKPEYNRKCNPKTGMETVVQKLPYIENCRRQYRVNVIHRKCKCNTKPRLIRQSQCSPECKVRYTWLMEKITPEGHCKFYYRVQDKSCCCPTEINLGTFCNRSIGLLETGYRNFTLINGKCLSKDRFIGKRIVCKKNEKIVKYQQPNGWIRIEKQVNIRDGCNCVRKLIVDYDKWNCPPPITQRRCVQANSEQFVLETISTKWKLSESKPTCSRLDTIIDRVPIDCSEEYVNKSTKCVMSAGRHALVRIDQVTTFHADGCRCIENSVRRVFTVCKCTRPHREKSCLYSEGVLIHQNVYYEVSGDKSRCLPRRSRRVIKITCSPVGPQYKGRTQCDAETGNFFHIYEEFKRVGCRCLKKELRIPGRCRCPEQRSEMRCSMQNVQQLNTTTYELNPKGTCTKSYKLQYKYIKCPLSDDLLQESTDYKVQQSQSLIKHIYKCGSAGKCMRIIQEYKTYTNYKCKCITERKQYREACCCPTEPDMIQFNLPNNSSQSVTVNTLCDPDKGLILNNTIRWNLEHGRCWPVIHRTILPVVCDKKEFFKPITVCRQGQQKNLHQREIREGCKCKLSKRIVTKPCTCDPLGIADVIFLVDETVKSRQMNYSYYVNKILKYTVNVFYESSQSSNIDEQFRFGVIKYSLRANIVSNLKSYPGLYELYAEIKKLTFNGRQSDLRVALNTVKNKILSQIRPGASLILYLITDAVVNQPTGVKQLSDYLKLHNVQINAILLMSGHIYHETLFKQLVSPPTALHLVRLKAMNGQFESRLSRIADTICKKVCPVNHKKESQCSRQTNCIGRVYNYMYRYNPVKGLCIGKTIVERKQCCCMQEVRRKTTCENNHLIQYTENWQLTTNGFCEQYVTRRDVTGLTISQCTPANQTFIKTCNIRGEAVQVTIYRYMENCKCKTKQTDKIVRCRCTKKHNTKTCFGDDLIVYHYHFERLLEGECLPQRRDVHKKLACKRPEISKSPCDSLTCQERITIVNYVAQRCICKRFVTVKHQTCCCKGNRTSNYVGCKHNDVKVFEEKVFDPKVRDGSCVQRVSYYFQPITCPNKPSITYHSCRRFNVEDSVKQGNYANDRVDPGLIYRLVEKVTWKIQDCDCRRYYESYFEACGCDESVIINNFVTTKNRCDQQTGAIMNYKQKVRLEIVGIPYEYTKLNRLNKLSDAKCRPYYVIESVRKIICPETQTSIGPCEPAENGRSYRAIKVNRWKQSNCVCQNLPPILIEKQICSCLPVRLQKKCVGYKNKLQIYVIKEKLIKTKLSSGKYKYECKIEQTMKENIIQCPKNILHYSECKNGKMKVMVKVYKVHNCKCQESIRRLQVQCNKREKSKNIKQVEPKSPKHILTTVEQIIECIDLLPSENCQQISRSSQRICEKSTRLSDLLCRRTCRRCLGCELSNIRYQMISANYPCPENDQHILNNFLIKNISTAFTLASCKLACANKANCLSFIYSMSHEFDSNIIDKTAKCMLYRVDLLAIKQHHHEQKHQKHLTGIILQQTNQRFDSVFSPMYTKQCFAFRKICKHTCSSPKLTEISKCECKVYKNHYDYPSESPKFKTSLHCSKRINVQYFIQSKSGICQEQNWQGYTPCSNPRYRDLSLRNSNNCNNLKSSLWCEAELANDQRRCKDAVFSRLCSKTCGFCTCYGINIFNGKCNSNGYKLNTYIIYKPHPISRICIIEVKKRLSICEYCPIGTFEHVHECDKLTKSRTVNKITAKLIKISPNIDGKPRFECSIQTKNFKFDCGKCLAAYRNKYSITSCKQYPMKSAQMKSVYQLNLITEYVISENGCCRTKRTERRFNCENCPLPRIKHSPCYNNQRLKHIIFYTRPWVTSSLKPNECIQRTITKREKCSVDHRLPKDECRDSLTRMDCSVLKQSRKCHLNSEEARSLCAKTCGFCN
ncbi:unnamed protein product [Schistosoma margrebowiei]|uniref:VWFA domain-containing protein n=1 Tax=Schistosoma margrebowiei TaxID=48269 RepID=A0AA84Z7J4_9TREM|nr:unnamed protein product [Schistosoma margrebowiei]